MEGMSEAFDGDVRGEDGSLERFASVWSDIIGTMRDPGSVWRLSLEVVVMDDRLPEVRDHLARAQRRGARGLVSLLMGGREEDVPERDVDTLGVLYTTLPTGLMAQWSFDPEGAPEAGQLTEGLRRLIDSGAAAAKKRILRSPHRGLRRGAPPRPGQVTRASLTTPLRALSNLYGQTVNSLCALCCRRDGGERIRGR